MATLEDILHDEVDAMEELQGQATVVLDEFLEGAKDRAGEIESIDDVYDLIDEIADKFEEELADLTTAAFAVGVKGVGDRGL